MLVLNPATGISYFVFPSNLELLTSDLKSCFVFPSDFEILNSDFSCAVALSFLVVVAIFFFFLLLVQNVGKLMLVLSPAIGMSYFVFPSNLALLTSGLKSCTVFPSDFEILNSGFSRDYESSISLQPKGKL